MCCSITTLCLPLYDWCRRCMSVSQTSCSSVVSYCLFIATMRKSRWSNTLVYILVISVLILIQVLHIVLCSCSRFKTIWVRRWNGFTTWPPVLGTSCSFWGKNGSAEPWHHWSSNSINSSKHRCPHWRNYSVHLSSVNANTKTLSCSTPLES